MLEECLDLRPHRCYVLQPWVKWGAAKVRDRTPSQRLHEAVQLSGWQVGWSVAGGECLSVKTSRHSLGPGQIQRLHDTLNKLGGITALVVNIPLIGVSQINQLSENLPGRLKIFDRAALVLNLVRSQVTKGTHAHAQLQLAELEYVSRRYKNDRAQYVMGIRKSQIMSQLESCHEQRELHRQRRKGTDIPVIAVVGYTNAGKSSLMSALVGSDVCQTSDRAFHTLDVLGRASQLPCGLRVLYMDTVGFLSDTPPLLAPLFTATLEDVLLADVLLHVVDTSHQEVAQQTEHVNRELQRIYEVAGQAQSPTIIVGNKLDLRKSPTNTDAHWELAVSAKTGTGIDALRLHTQEQVLAVTDRAAFTIRLPTGSDEVRWMYKNAVVLKESPDSQDAQATLVQIITTKAKINQFYSKFVKKNK